MSIVNYFLNPNVRVLYFYRLSERIRPKNRLLRVFSTLIRNHLKVKYSVEFNNVNKIGSGFKIYHFNGIVIGAGVVIGDNLTLYNNVTLGGKRLDDRTEYPVIGNNVTIYPGARIIGGIYVGDGAIVGPNVVLYKDLQPNEVAVAANYITLNKKLQN